MKCTKIGNILMIVEIAFLGVFIFQLSSNLTDTWNALWKIMLFFGFIYFSYLFIRIHKNEKKIISLYEERDVEITKIESQCVSQGVIDGLSRREELFFKEKISPLERQRKYDLEKIPFLKN